MVTDLDGACALMQKVCDYFTEHAIAPQEKKACLIFSFSTFFITMAGLKRKATSQADGNDTNKKSKSGKSSGDRVAIEWCYWAMCRKANEWNTGSHQQQKALKLERKAQDPKFDMMTKTKKIWETLRRGDISKEETKDLMSQIMALIAGHVKEVRYKRTAIQQVA